ncbi:MAG TPA: 16S rRNA (guanine(966)-N(2))-methyltransferase RsmD [Pseudogracilibacillus sp.]|nr:16S rRNA (guanine(966)-N(2))-methyltransferase RsmD [Pseudogracilibacillus sp.]
MRVIAGTHKSRTIKPVKNDKTRPTSDKVREAIFHKAGPFFEGGSGLDLFAGSGALGIEALSRGMDEMIFIDTQTAAIRTIKNNLQELQLEAQSKVYKKTAVAALEILYRKQLQFDFILIDPPYESTNYEELIQKIVDYDLVKQDGVIYIELSTNKAFSFPDDSYAVLFEKTYNRTTKTIIYQKVNREETGR